MPLLGQFSGKYPNAAFCDSSDSMKQRAIKRVDIAGPAKQRDIRSKVGIYVVVAPDIESRSIRDSYISSFALD